MEETTLCGSCGQGESPEGGTMPQRLSARAVVCDHSEKNVLRRYMRKVLLLQRSLFWMKELENLAQWRRFAAVTRMECVDHAAMLGCLGGSLWASWAACRRKVVVAADVMYLKGDNVALVGRTPRGMFGSECREWARRTMRAAAATGQS